nr:hypothetical protein Q903MT_gene4904 [Picea sitchensis]
MKRNQGPNPVTNHQSSGRPATELLTDSKVHYQFYFQGSLSILFPRFTINSILSNWLGLAIHPLQDDLAIIHSHIHRFILFLPYILAWKFIMGQELRPLL